MHRPNLNYHTKYSKIKTISIVYLCIVGYLISLIFSGYIINANNDFVIKTNSEFSSNEANFIITAAADYENLVWHFSVVEKGVRCQEEIFTSTSRMISSGNALVVQANNLDSYKNYKVCFKAESNNQTAYKEVLILEDNSSDEDKSSEQTVIKATNITTTGPVGNLILAVVIIVAVSVFTFVVHLRMVQHKHKHKNHN